jgi:hypothetical protein
MDGGLLTSYKCFVPPHRHRLGIGLWPLAIGKQPATEQHKHKPCELEVIVSCVAIESVL